MRKGSVFVLLALLSFAGCLEDPPTAQEILNANLKKIDQVQLQADIEAIDAYLEDNLIENVLEESHGVRYVISGSLGSGAKPKLSSNILFDYEGMLLSDGSTFDEGSNAFFPLTNLIVAWQLVLPLLPAGTSVTMYIPSGLAYGSQGIKNANGDTIIPPNANLIFDVYLEQVH